MFGKRKPMCLVCHDFMENVEVWEVPSQIKSDYMRLGKYSSLTLDGWYRCSECDIFIHQPTIERVRLH
jgi:hypothetical protein